MEDKAHREIKEKIERLTERINRLGNEFEVSLVRGGVRNMGNSRPANIVLEEMEILRAEKETLINLYHSMPLELYPIRLYETVRLNKVSFENKEIEIVVGECGFIVTKHNFTLGQTFIKGIESKDNMPSKLWVEIVSSETKGMLVSAYHPLIIEPMATIRPKIEFKVESKPVIPVTREEEARQSTKFLYEQNWVCGHCQADNLAVNIICMNCGKARSEGGQPLIRPKKKGSIKRG